MNQVNEKIKSAGEFTVIGIGPGDPDLITVKAIKKIEETDIIAVPQSGAKANIAITIANEYIKDKPVLMLDMPMTKDRNKLREYHEKSADKIEEIILEGKDVSFLTLGDPAIYSTGMYVHKILKNRGVKTKMIPGVPSFCGAAASLDVSLCEREQMLHIVPATFKGDMADELKGTRVLMKSGKTIGKIKERLKSQNAMMVECATMDNEKIHRDMIDVEDHASYFSLIIVPSKDESEV